MDNQNNNTVGRPQADSEECFTKIQPFLQLGYSFHKACLYAQIPYTTYKKYYDENEDFHNKIDRERSLISVTARKNIIKTIESGDYKASLRWLESFEKEDFSTELKESKQNTSNITYKPPSWFQNPDTEKLEE